MSIFNQVFKLTEITRNENVVNRGRAWISKVQRNGYIIQPVHISLFFLLFICSHARHAHNSRLVLCRYVSLANVAALKYDTSFFFLISEVALLCVLLSSYVCATMSSLIRSWPRMRATPQIFMMMSEKIMLYKTLFSNSHLAFFHLLRLTLFSFGLACCVAYSLVSSSLYKLYHTKSKVQRKKNLMEDTHACMIVSCSLSTKMTRQEKV